MPKAVGGNSASGRKIGYWQSSNVRKRQYKDGKFKCPPVRPGDIPLDTNIPSVAVGRIYTMLLAPLYTEFTALKYRPNGPQTWIAVGGFDFSDPGVDPDAETDTAPDVSTHSTWSDMAMTTDRRTAFIQLLITFMDKYGFQGIDLDWEYPVSEDRGGRPEDTKNFVSLVREMRQAFGTKYGISVALAPDFWYLRYFDAVAMQPYVDWFGFMAYDLHGVWASDSKSKLVRGHTDAEEIYKDIIPLSFDGLDFRKINFGMAIYGRGFTLADPKCRAMDGTCSWTGGNEAGICTDFSGVLSYDEIQQKILDAQRQNRAGPTLDPTTMMKYLTWGDKQQNWIGYYDQETWQLKKTNLADKYGFGGTLFWSVDFMGQGMNISDVYIDPSLVCQDGNNGNRIASCHQPCRLIMPQCAIPTTTVTATYTITFEVYQGPSSTLTETMITEVTVTTASISFSPVYVGGGRNGGDTFTPVPIIPMPSMILSVTPTAGGTVTTRTVTLPNWPTTGQWPPPGGVTNQDPWQAPTHSDASSSTSTQEPFAPLPPLYPITGPTDPPVPKETDFRTTETTETTSTTTAAVVIMTWPPGVIEPTDNDDDDIIPCHAWFLTGFKLNFPIPPGLYIFPPPDPPSIKPPPGMNINLKPEPHIILTRGKDNKWTTSQRSDQTSSCAHSTTVFDTATSVTATVTISGKSTWTSTATVRSTQIPRTGCHLQATATTGQTFVTNTNCPHARGIVAFERKNEEDDSDSDGSDADGSDSDSSEWADHQLHSAQRHANNKSLGHDDNLSQSRPGKNTRKSTSRRHPSAPQSPHRREENNDIDIDCWFGHYGILLPADPLNVVDIDRLLDDYKANRNLQFTKIWAPSHRGFTAGYFLEDATIRLENELIALRNSGILRPFFYIDHFHFSDSSDGSLGGSLRRRTRPVMSFNITETKAQNREQEVRRSTNVVAKSSSWSASQVSVPRGVRWPNDQSRIGNDYHYYYHPSAGQGQNIHVCEADDIPWHAHTVSIDVIAATLCSRQVHSDHVGQEFSNFQSRNLPVRAYSVRGGPVFTGDGYHEPLVHKGRHASQVAAMAVGQHLGIAKRANLWTSTAGAESFIESDVFEVAFWLNDALVEILESIASQNNAHTAVLSISFDSELSENPAMIGLDLMGTIFCWFRPSLTAAILFEFYKLNIPIIMSSGNIYNKDPAILWPPILAYETYRGYNSIPGTPNRNELRNFANSIMLVGATTKNGPKADFSQFSSLVQLHAPAKALWEVQAPKHGNGLIETNDADAQGTSYAAPQVAGLIAYFRALPNTDLQKRLSDVRTLKYFLGKLARVLNVMPGLPMPPKYKARFPETLMVRTIWNGQLPEDLSCLVQEDIDKMTEAQRNVCPDIKNDKFWNDAKYWNAISTTEDNDKGQTIEWQPGEPGPLCSAAAPSTTPSKGSGRATLPPELNGRAPQIVLGPGQCGTGCNSDWYCDDSPDGVPPFYRDPKDPNKSNPYLGILPVPIPIPTPLPSTAPQVRHCHFHITKIFTYTTSIAPTSPTLSRLACTSYDPNNANTVLGTKNIGTASGNKLVWSASQSRLPADIHFALSSCLVPRSMNFRRGVDGTDDTDSTDSVDEVDSADGTDGADSMDGSDDSPLESDNCVITFTTSGHTWSTDDRDSAKAAYCNVGKYSGHLTQDMDCFYTC
ncbi:uncharacterized protein SPSK_02915 [Sporothrix schenckii 1099-18]|uniref:chitinase n=1 Tax=Sporothrix schenckii 1099-18 TaxID=1397361 RepID=A0A0F2LZU9_SPOSC|nr:uncharacterized protein SPSK_02915 [Sporothrix schenckii 1099-18]KJR82025.1 hypothetical protein SPSK_02915 [Sporothrix schenckii 1099-18]